MVGDGVPLGAAQIKRAVPPLTTPVSSGSSRNLSRKTGKKWLLELKRFDLKFLQINLCREHIRHVKIPLRAAQIKRAVPPLTTPVSSGSSRNLSLKTEKKVIID